MTKRARKPNPAVSLETRQQWPEYWFREWLDASLAGDVKGMETANRKLAKLAGAIVQKAGEVMQCTSK
jgi:hypothetical protein